MWTHFMDMHSGGGTKIEPFENIYIEAPEKEARVIFYNRFGRNPDRITCTCCGNDYSVSEESDLSQATAYERGCEYAYVDADGKEYNQNDWYNLSPQLRGSVKGRYVERQARPSFGRPHISLAQFKLRKDVLIISADEIKETERVGEVPQQGYVWQD